MWLVVLGDLFILANEKSAIFWIWQQLIPQGNIAFSLTTTDAEMAKEKENVLQHYNNKD